MSKSNVQILEEKRKCGMDEFSYFLLKLTENEFKNISKKLTEKEKKLFEKYKEDISNEIQEHKRIGDLAEYIDKLSDSDDDACYYKSCNLKIFIKRQEIKTIKKDDPSIEVSAETENGENSDVSETVKVNTVDAKKTMTELKEKLLTFAITEDPYPDFEDFFDTTIRLIKKGESTDDLKKRIRKYVDKPLEDAILDLYDEKSIKDSILCIDIITEFLQTYITVYPDEEVNINRIEKCIKSIQQLRLEKISYLKKYEYSTEITIALRNKDDSFEFSENTNEGDDMEYRIDEDDNFEDRLSEFKVSFLNDNDKKYGKTDWDVNLLVNKISSSIRDHSSSELQKYLREYTSIPMLRNIKSDYDRAMSSCCCADLIQDILDGLKSVFKNDAIALHHIDKCYFSIEQLAEDKHSLAKKLKITEEKKNEDIELLKKSLYKYFNNEEYNNISPQSIIDATINLIKKEHFDSLEEQLKDLLLETAPNPNSLESIQKCTKNILRFEVSYTTCTSSVEIFDNPKLTQFVSYNLKRLYKIYDDVTDRLNEVATLYKKKQKTKANWKKAGNILGTVALSPLIALTKAAEWSEQYEKRPDVQERRRAENIKYYCKYCGQSFRNPRDAAYSTCGKKLAYDRTLSELQGTSCPSVHYHMIYEGGEKTVYECRYCHMKYRSIFDLVNNTCGPRVRQNRDKYGSSAQVVNISRCEPAL